MIICWGSMVSGVMAMMGRPLGRMYLVWVMIDFSGTCHRGGLLRDWSIAGYSLNYFGILSFALRFMAEALDPQLRAEAPNGAAVFDLGTM